MSVVAYLMDENVDPRILSGLRRQWPEMRVQQVGQADAPPFDTADLDLLRWCESNAMSLVTNNSRSMPLHLRGHIAAGRHVPGIFILDDSRPMGETIARPALIWGASDAEEYYDQIVYLTQVT